MSKAHTKNEIEQVAKTVGLHVSTSPGDGTTRYRFFAETDYFANDGYFTGDGVATLLGTGQALLWLRGYQAGRACHVDA